jgi:hypothetical protein
VACDEPNRSRGTESDGRDGRAEPAHESFEDHHGLVVLNHAATEVQDYIVALVVLFTVGGTPSIYVGHEQAFRGIKEERGNRLRASSPRPTRRYGGAEPQVGGRVLDVGRNLD